jgi:hypothetical protein
VPLGPPGNFIEISGFVDIFTLRNMNDQKEWILDITETGDPFNGLCLAPRFRCGPAARVDRSRRASAVRQAC